MYKQGDHNVICDSCGLQFYRSECKINWKNLLQCEGCYDIKHPQLTVRGRKENVAVDIARPQSDDDNDLTFGEGSASEL